jgi:hypothetical protein
VYDDTECTDAQVYAETCESPSTMPSAANGDEAGVRDPESAGQPRTVRATYTWAELGLDPELQALLAGRTYVYSTQDGERFEAATLPDDIAGSAARAVATSTGYTVFVGDWTEAASSTRVLTSADGLAFGDAPGSPLPGGMADTGVLADQPAVALHSPDGVTTVRLGRADGGWAELPLSGPGSFSSDVAFGPLGMAAVVYEESAGDDPSVPHLVHTADGINLSSVSLEDELGASAANVIGVSVTADAIFVRIGGPVDDDPGTPPVQRVLVGTPV